MNDLDRRIAELKGLKIDCMAGDSRGVLEIWLERIPGSQSYEAQAAWSTSDAKALELVDELLGLGQGWAFMLIDLEDSGWLAQFDKDPEPEPLLNGEAPTRPEAICRAYIAAAEWMRDRK